MLLQYEYEYKYKKREIQRLSSVAGPNMGSSRYAVYGGSSLFGYKQVSVAFFKDKHHSPSPMAFHGPEMVSGAYFIR